MDYLRKTHSQTKTWLRSALILHQPLSKWIRACASKYLYCSRCRISKDVSSFSRRMRETIYDNSNRKCENCVDEEAHQDKYCSICQTLKDRSLFSNKMRTANYNNSNRKCQDCASPVCKHPSCRTCTACRDPNCRVKKNYQKPIFELHWKFAPKTKTDVDSFFCSACQKKNKPEVATHSIAEWKSTSQDHTLFSRWMRSGSCKETTETARIVRVASMQKSVLQDV